jgi:hypothetical protein
MKTNINALNAYKLELTALIANKHTTKTIRKLLVKQILKTERAITKYLKPKVITTQDAYDKIQVIKAKHTRTLKEHNTLNVLNRVMSSRMKQLKAIVFDEATDYKLLDRAVYALVPKHLQEDAQVWALAQRDW